MGQPVGQSDAAASHRISINGAPACEINSPPTAEVFIPRNDLLARSLNRASERDYEEARMVIYFHSVSRVAMRFRLATLGRTVFDKDVVRQRVPTRICGACHWTPAAPLRFAVRWRCWPSIATPPSRPQPSFSFSDGAQTLTDNTPMSLTFSPS
jgi:hypothetical protein